MVMVMVMVAVRMMYVSERRETTTLIATHDAAPPPTTRANARTHSQRAKPIETARILFTRGTSATAPSCIEHYMYDCNVWHTFVCFKTNSMM